MTLYRCGHCGFEGHCYGTPTSKGMSVPWCSKCQKNDKLTKIEEPKERPELLIMMGLPRSGKSSYVDTLSNFNIVCADDIRLALGTQFDERLEPHVWAVHGTMLRALMIRGCNVVVDSTHTTESYFKKYSKLAYTYNYKMRVVYVCTPKKVCIERNVGEGAVPVEVIARMSDQIEALLLLGIFEVLAQKDEYVHLELKDSIIL